MVAHLSLYLDTFLRPGGTALWKAWLLENNAGITMVLCKPPKSPHSQRPSPVVIGSSSTQLPGKSKKHYTSHRTAERLWVLKSECTLVWHDRSKLIYVSPKGHEEQQAFVRIAASKHVLNPTYKFQALAVGATKDCDPQFTLSWVEIRENQYEPSRIEAYYRVFDDAKWPPTGWSGILQHCFPHESTSNWYLPGYSISWLPI